MTTPELMTARISAVEADLGKTKEDLHGYMGAIEEQKQIFKDAVARSLTETINIVDLENEVDNKEGKEFDYARRYIARHRENGTRRGDFSSLTVS